MSLTTIIKLARVLPWLLGIIAVLAALVAAARASDDPFAVADSGGTCSGVVCLAPDFAPGTKAILPPLPAKGESSSGTAEIAAARKLCDDDAAAVRDIDAAIIAKTIQRDSLIKAIAGHESDRDTKRRKLEADYAILRQLEDSQYTSGGTSTVPVEPVTPVPVVPPKPPTMEVIELSWATGCPHCERMQPVVAQMRQEGWLIRTINIDGAYSGPYKGRPVPSFIILANGHEADGKPTVGEVALPTFRAWLEEWQTYLKTTEGERK